MTDGYHSGMPGRARPYAALLGVLLVVAGGPARAGRAQAAGSGASGHGTATQSGHGTATQSGWWNRLQGPAEGEPDANPVRPLVPAVPKPPTVPPDAVAAGAGGGQPDKVAAVGLDLAVAPGAAVEGLVLRLEESKAGGANMGADQAKVTACPATVPWGPSQNAAWRERPAADCNLGSAGGVRADDGTWTFDLTAIARRWTAPDQPLAPNGVVLAVDPAGSAAPVQISWLDVDSGHVAVDLTVTPAAPAAAGAPGAGPATGAAPPAAPGVPSPGDAASGLPALPSPGGAPVSGGPAPAGRAAWSIGLSAAGSPDAPVTAAAAPAEVALPGTPARPGPAGPARPAVRFWARLPRASALLLPFAAALAVLVGLVLGPAGRPLPVFRREGGLSRALARRPPAA